MNEEKVLNMLNRFQMYILAGLLLAVAQPPHALAQQNLALAKSASSETVAQQDAPRDGQHDFDFELGSWKIHLKRLQKPLTGSTTWIEFDGTTVTRKVWGGKSQINEFESDGATGHIEGLTLRTYNSPTYQWTLYWANSTDGI